MAILWVSASNLASWQASSRGFDQAATPWDSLTTSRIEAQQARTAETLALVRRQPLGEDGTDPFNEATLRITRALDDVEKGDSAVGDSPDSAALVHEARTALQEWRTAHGELTRALNAGDFAASERLTTDTTRESDSAPTTATAFNDLDRALAELIAESRTTMRSYIADGLAATTLVAASVLLLSLGAVIAVVVGIRPRFQEYL